MLSFFHQLLHAGRGLRIVADSRPALKWSLWTLYWLPVGVVVNQYLFAFKIVTGRSMQPTLNPESSMWRDVVIFDRFSTRTRLRYCRQDVVALSDPITKELIVKRIIGLEGDIVSTLPPYPDSKVLIPEGHAWVEGDEPFRSADSNRFGPVPLALIDSKLTFIIWPLYRFGPLRRPSLPVVSAQTPKGPSWRHEVSCVERERWRRSRVLQASIQSTPGR